jgi:hypothetical protein
MEVIEKGGKYKFEFSGTAIAVTPRRGVPGARQECDSGSMVCSRGVRIRNKADAVL